MERCHFRILKNLHIYVKTIPRLVLKTTLSFLLGCMPNITRNAIVNCAELVTYDMIKELILKYDLMTGELLRKTDSKS